jgi:hypothetical protein
MKTSISGPNKKSWSRFLHKFDCFAYFDVRILEDRGDELRRRVEDRVSFLEEREPILASVYYVLLISDVHGERRDE